MCEYVGLCLATDLYLSNNKISKDEIIQIIQSKKELKIYDIIDTSFDYVHLRINIDFFEKNIMVFLKEGLDKLVNYNIIEEMINKTLLNIEGKKYEEIIDILYGKSSGLQIIYGQEVPYIINELFDSLYVSAHGVAIIQNAESFKQEYPSCVYGYRKYVLNRLDNGLKDAIVIVPIESF